MPYNALGRDEATGRFDWPPRDAATGKRPQRRCTDQMVDVLWTLAHADGIITDASGLAVRRLLDAVNDPDLFAASEKAPYTTINRTIGDLIELGLVEVERRGRRTFAYGLTIDADEIPVPDPFPLEFRVPDGPDELTIDALVVGETYDEDVLDALAEREGVVVIGRDDEVDLDDRWNLGGEATRELFAAPALAADAATEVAHALLNEVLGVLGRGGGGTDVEGKDFPYYRREIRKRDDRIAALERDLDVLRGRAKSLSSDLGEERRLRQGVERNLGDVLRGVTEYQSRQSSTITDENRETLDRIMRKVPGFDYDAVHGNGNGAR